MSFFDSEIVRSEMAEIHELQEDVYENYSDEFTSIVDNYIKDNLQSN